MTIGLVLLGLFSIFVFFGLIGNLLKKIGMPDWVAFAIILSLTLGVVLPPLNIFGASVSISGYLVPMVLLAILFVRIGFSSEIFASVWASALSAGLCALFFAWYPSQLEQTYLYSILLGSGVAILSTLATRRHKSALFGCIGGVLLFELGLGIYDKLHNAETIYLGSLYTLDVILIASTIAMVLLEAIGGVQEARTREQDRQHRTNTNMRLAMMTESAAETNIEMMEYYKQQGDYSKIYPEDFVSTNNASDNHVESLSVPTPREEIASKLTQGTGKYPLPDNTQEQTETKMTPEEQEEFELKNKYLGYFGDNETK